jgi:hypothetical protein
VNATGPTAICVDDTYVAETTEPLSSTTDDAVKFFPVKVSAPVLYAATDAGETAVKIGAGAAVVTVKELTLDVPPAAALLRTVTPMLAGTAI